MNQIPDEFQTGAGATPSAELAARLSAQFSASLDAVPDLLCEFDRHGRCLAATGARATALPADPRQWVGRRLDEVLPLSAAEALRLAIAEARRRGRDCGRVFPWPQGGEPRWFEVSAARKPAQDGTHATVVLVVRDITDRQQAALAAQQTHRALRLLTDCSTALVRAEDEAWLLQEACRLLCESGGYLMAWIGFAETDPDCSVRPVAQWGFERDYLRDVRVSWSEATPLGNGPTGTAIRTAATQVNQDFLRNQATAPWWEAADRRGFQSNIALPLCGGTRVLGALTIYAAEPFAFSPEEIALLEDLARNLAFGVEALRERQRRVAAEAATQARGAVLAGLAQAFRTPLNSILDLTRRALDTGPTAAQRGYLDAIQTAGRGLLHRLDNVLECSPTDLPGPAGVASGDGASAGPLDPAARPGPAAGAHALPFDPDEVARPRVSDRLHPMGPPGAEPPAPAPSAPGLDTLAVAGLDAAIGLRRCLGREDLYRSLLETFVSTGRAFPERLRTALTAGDGTTAVRLAHTLKGDAAQLGAGRLRALAAALEQALKEGRPAEDLSAATAPLVHCLADLTSAVATALQTAPVTPPPPPLATPVSPPRLAAACGRLAEALAACDFRSGEVLAAERDLLTAAFGGELTDITEAIETFDFAAALTRLRDSAARLGVALSEQNSTP